MICVCRRRETKQGTLRCTTRRSTDLVDEGAVVPSLVARGAPRVVPREIRADVVAVLVARGARERVFERGALRVALLRCAEVADGGVVERERAVGVPRLGLVEERAAALGVSEQHEVLAAEHHLLGVRREPHRLDALQSALQQARRLAGGVAAVQEELGVDVEDAPVVRVARDRVGEERRVVAPDGHLPRRELGLAAERRGDGEPQSERRRRDTSRAARRRRRLCRRRGVVARPTERGREEERDDGAERERGEVAVPVAALLDHAVLHEARPRERRGDDVEPRRQREAVAGYRRGDGDEGRPDSRGRRDADLGRVDQRADGVVRAGARRRRRLERVVRAERGWPDDFGDAEPERAERLARALAERPQLDDVGGGVLAEAVRAHRHGDHDGRDERVREEARA
mmetsp:Transcript_4006/g.16016  ORF Transcript_4006/g.16016 Transcript_4006/m.16016 type:complete len:401 (-) Transcript_4006:914-2116(-)